MSYFPYVMAGKMVPDLARATERTTPHLYVIFSSFCGYLNLGKHQCTILKYYRKFTSCYDIIVWTDYRRTYMLFSLKCTIKDLLISILKGNNSCKTNNFRIKVGNSQTVLLCNPNNTVVILRSRWSLH